MGFAVRLSGLLILLIRGETLKDYLGMETGSSRGYIPSPGPKPSDVIRDSASLTDIAPLPCKYIYEGF